MCFSWSLHEFFISGVVGAQVDEVWSLDDLENKKLFFILIVLFFFILSDKYLSNVYVK